MEIDMAFEYDYHVHTTLSYCHEGELTINRLSDIAITKGLKGFAVTDHAHHLYFDDKAAWRYEYITNYDLFLEQKDEGDRNFGKYLNMIADYKKRSDRLNILTGTEVDVALNGELFFDSEYRDRLDLIIGGIHWLPCLRNGLDSKSLLADFMDFTMMLLEHELTILAHPTRIFRAHKLEVPREVVKPIVLKAKEKGTAIEINSHNYPDPDVYFIHTCVDEGVKLSLGTDTHRIGEFGDFSMQKRILSEAGISDRDFDSIIFSHEKA